METIEQQRHSLSSLPMLSRLDHLDFVIENLERQQNVSKWKDESVAATRGLIDRGTAIREAYFKGSLLDRITALETRLTRLFQICLELESSSASSTSTSTSTSTGETSSNQRIKKDLTKTLPIFTSNINPFHVPLQHPQHLPEMKEKIEEEKEEEMSMEKPLLEKRRKKKKRTTNTKKEATETCKSKKKKKTTESTKKWSRFSFLGC